jgi:hypothetical protein
MQLLNFSSKRASSSKSYLQSLITGINAFECTLRKIILAILQFNSLRTIVSSLMKHNDKFVHEPVTET